MVGEGCEWKLDPGTGRATITGTFDNKIATFASLHDAGNGRTYLACSYLKGTILRLYERLGPGDWHATPDGAEGKRARLCLSADAPCAIRLVWGWASPAYGVVRPAPVLELAVAAPVARIVTRVEVA